MRDNTIINKNSELSLAWDHESIDYDDQLNRNIISENMRTRSIEYQEKYFLPGMNLLEIGCGTGEEAIHNAKRNISVHGVDISPSMIELSEIKAHTLGLSNLCSFEVKSADDINEIDCIFDSAYSSFGVLNCIADLQKFSCDINEKIVSGGYLIVSVMSKYCIAEILYYLLHFQFSKSIRRISKNRIIINLHDNSHSFTCKYYTPKQLFKFFRNVFVLEQVIAIPFLLIPDESLAAFLKKKKIFFMLICSLDKFLCRLPVFRSCGDHFLMILKKR